MGETEEERGEGEEKTSATDSRDGGEGEVAAGGDEKGDGVGMIPIAPKGYGYCPNCGTLMSARSGNRAYYFYQCQHCGLRPFDLNAFC